uniref:RRM domain-containing protein n=1 Tax=Kalanchoe fedtschenkoi TaxID=63787 RepID=A0A7N0TIG5_KALFE
MRGRSYTPSPPRGGYGRRRRSPSPRGRYAARDHRDYPTSLLVRNLRHDCRPEDLRRPFGQFGPLKDIYLPRDYYTGQPRGFGFVQYVDPADAAEAKYQMDGQILLGRELTVVFAEENRKKPADMRARDRGRSYDRRRSPRSPSPRRYARDRSRSHGYSPTPKRREYSRSVSPEVRRVTRDRSGSRPRYSRERSYSRSPASNGSRSRSQTPIRGRGHSPNAPHSREPSRELSPGR